MMRRWGVNPGLIIIIFLSGATTLRAQSSGAQDHKFEAGVHFTALRSSVPREVDFTNFRCIATPCTLNNAIISTREFQSGVGARFGYNATGYLALEAEVNLFPGANSFSVPASFRGGHKIEGLFGVKAGKRSDRIGLFAKARPGFLYSSKGTLRPIPNTACLTIAPGDAGCLETIAKNRFALDLGGVIEIYPTTRTVIRIDAGDTIVRFEERSVSATLNPGPGLSSLPRQVALPVAAETTHNFQASIGIGFRF